ncbi:uncharacterized protein C8Q71DRAFT_911987 [Rhodofomes roseus]|uniref:Fungal-type protein kinase domain-containing protein n=1 Tax=Rhodofomes roseus TaxID=34475 RepID=A0ABQ8JY18_9APHY|nr:uncharacterized protein C8Q71DRAFT_911987 [Rhodofomes roseus]KAH9829144.1 hypothetical protein C8Q71DRAFT_911987 [Rhodofomes roseus]
MAVPRAHHAAGSTAEYDLPRVSRKLMTRGYQPLETIGSAQRFHSVFVDALRAHHWVYEKYHMLHCNIELNSIMWYERDGRVVGALCDWDLAEDQGTGGSRTNRRAGDNAAMVWPLDWKENSVAKATTTELRATAEDQATEQPPKLEGAAPSNVATDSQCVVKPRYRTGTGPFMAMDLLRVGDPPIHKYRHDLESFFYAYIYFAATYNPEQQAFGYIKEWQRASLVDIGHSKGDFLLEEKVRTRVMKPAHHTLKPLLAKDTPLMKLLEEFNEIELDWRIIKVLGSKSAPSERTRAQIQFLEQGREAKMSFSIFMKILGAPEEESV